MLRIILLKAGAEKTRVLNKSLKQLFDEFQTSLKITVSSSGKFPPDIGSILGRVFRNSKALVFIKVDCYYASIQNCSLLPLEGLVDGFVASSATLKGLRTLLLPGNGIGTNEDMAKALMMMTGLRVLDLSMNKMGPSGSALLAPSLMALTGLNTLDLWDNDIGPAGAASLAPSLMALTGLHALGLSNNGISSEVTASLKHSLARKGLCWLG